MSGKPIISVPLFFQGFSLVLSIESSYSAFSFYLTFSVFMNLGETVIYCGLEECFFFFFWLHWVFIALPGLSLVAVSGGYSSLQCAASHCGGFSSCGAQALGAQVSVVVARGLSSHGARA